jgi:hypothetical protein
MSRDFNNFDEKKIPRKDFLKIMGAGSLFVGLGALGIPNILKNFREASALTASAQGANATNTTNATGATSTNTTNATGASVAPTSGNTDIRPFSVNVPEADLVELRRRIEATRWPDKETVTDASQGVQLATIQKLAHYWATEYDWRKVETKLKALPQFITNIVVFTASSDQKLFIDMKNNGIKEVFKKPCSLDQLTASIEKYRPRA